MLGPRLNTSGFYLKIGSFDLAFNRGPAFNRENRLYSKLHQEPMTTLIMRNVWRKHQKRMFTLGSPDVLYNRIPKNHRTPNHKKLGQQSHCAIQRNNDPVSGISSEWIIPRKNEFIIIVGISNARDSCFCHVSFHWFGFCSCLATKPRVNKQQQTWLGRFSVLEVKKCS